MMLCDDERRCLVQLSLDLEEEMLLRRLAEAEGLAPATLAHQAMMWGLRHLHEVYGGGHALPTPVRVGARAYPLRRVVDLRHEIVADLGDAKLDRATQVLECGHTGHTYIVVYPAEFWPDQRRRCAQCATPEQRARAREETVRR